MKVEKEQKNSKGGGIKKETNRVVGKNSLRRVRMLFMELHVSLPESEMQVHPSCSIETDTVHSDRSLSLPSPSFLTPHQASPHISHWTCLAGILSGTS